MKKIFWIILVLFFLVGCIGAKDKSLTQVKKIPTLDEQLDSLTNQIISSMDEEGKKTIAIIEFSNLDGEITEFGKYLAEELITRLFITQRFDVIERQMLNKVLNEQKLGASGIIDEDSAVSIGQLLGVDAIVTGSITDLGTTLKINTRMISTESGSIFSVASTKIYKDFTVRKLIKQESKKEKSGTQMIQTSAPQKFSRKVFKEDISYELIGCEMNERLVVFTLIITNTKEDDVDLRISYANPLTRIFNEFGEEYNVSKVKLANSEMEFPRGAYYRSLTKTLVSGVPITATIEFDNVSAKTEKVSLLEINCGDIGLIEFREIEILK